MFWGLIMEPQRRYSQVIKKSFHISMAALDISTADDEPAQVMCGFEGRNYLLCTLKKPEVVQVQLDLNFEKGSEVSFATNGRCIVHLTGYLNDDVIPSFDEEDDLEEEEEEDSEVELISEDNKKRQKVKSLNGPPAKKAKAEDSAVISSTQLLKSSEDDDGSDDSDDSDVDMSELLLKDSDDSEEEDDEEEEAEEEEAEDEEGDSDLESDEDYDVGEDEDLSSLSEDEGFQNQLGKSKPKLNGEAKKKDMTPNKQKAKEEKTPSKQKEKQNLKTPKSETKNKEKGNKSLNAEAKSPKELKTPGKEQKKQKEGKQKEQGKTPSKEQSKTPGKEQGKTPKEQGKTPSKEQGKTPGKEQGKSPKKKVLQGGVIIEEIREGSGDTAKSGRMVHVHYEGRFKDSNKMFDSATKGPGFGFRLGRGEVIKGWDIGVAGMKLGGKRRIICPPQMAYGQKGSPPEIPPNSTLVFEVELKKVS